MSLEDVIRQGVESGLSRDEVLASVDLALATADRQQRETAAAASAPAGAPESAPAPEAPAASGWHPGLDRRPTREEFDAMTLEQGQMAVDRFPDLRDRFAAQERYGQLEYQRLYREKQAAEQAEHASRYEADLAYRQSVDELNLAERIADSGYKTMGDVEFAQAVAAAGSALSQVELPFDALTRIECINARLAEVPKEVVGAPSGFRLPGQGDKRFRLKPE